MTSLWLLASCTVPSLPGDDSRCDDRELEQGEVRLRKIPCNAERISDGDGRRGDWLLENSEARFVFRAVGGSLSDVEGSAGGMVDAARPNGIDSLVELRPLEFEFHSAAAESSEDRGTLRILGLHRGEEAEIVYRLAADDPVLRIESPASWLLAPGEGSRLYGSTVEPGHGRYVYAFQAGLEADLGGSLQLSDLEAFAVGEWEEVHGWLDPNAVWAEGEADAAWVEAVPEGTARLPVKDRVFGGWLPSGTESVRAAQDGCKPGVPGPLEGEGSLETGECGSMLARVRDEDGTPLPALLHWEGGTHPIPPGGERIALPPLAAGAWIEAGPGYEAFHAELDTAEHPSLSVVLRRTAPEGVLFMPHVLASPDRRIREDGAVLLRKAAGRGAALAVLASGRVVSPFSPPGPGRLWEPWIHVQQASFAEEGLVQAWPWSRNRNLPGFGAAPSHMLSPADLLSFSKKGGRMTMVGTDWAEDSGPLHEWEMRPDFIWVGGAEDLESYYGLLGSGLPLAPLGPVTWIHGLAGRTAQPEEILMQALDHRVTAGNGPWLEIEAGGASTGEPFPGGEERLEIRIRLETPEWMPMEELRLVGPGGELASWELAGPGVTVEAEIGMVDWIVAEARGPAAPPMLEEEAWAVTATSWQAP